MKDLYSEAKLSLGIIEFLEKLKEEKKQCFISSACEESEVIWFCRERQIDSFFQRIYGSPSTKKNHIDKIYSELGQKPSLFFGDSYKDYQAAAYGKMDFVFISDYTMQREWFELSQIHSYPTFEKFLSIDGEDLTKLLFSYRKQILLMTTLLTIDGLLSTFATLGIAPIVDTVINTGEKQSEVSQRIFFFFDQIGLSTNPSFTYSPF